MRILTRHVTALCVTIARMDLATRRFVDLADFIGDSVGRTYGWRTKAAALLKITPSYLTRILKGERGISTAVISKLKWIHPKYFSTGSIDERLDPRPHLTALGRELFEIDLGDLVADHTVGAGGVVERASELEADLTAEGWSGVVASVYESMALAFRTRNHRLEAQNIADAVWSHPSHRIFKAANALHDLALKPEATDGEILAQMRHVADLAEEYAAHEARQARVQPTED